MVVPVGPAISWKGHRIGRGLLGPEGVGGPRYGDTGSLFLGYGRVWWGSGAWETSSDGGKGAYGLGL